MEKLLNNNERSFSIDGNMGKRELLISEIACAQDFSFYSYGQSLALKVHKDNEVFSKLISKYPMKDKDGTVAEINERFTDFNEVIVEVFADNPLLSVDLNFNVTVNYEIK